MEVFERLGRCLLFLTLLVAVGPACKSPTTPDNNGVMVGVASLIGTWHLVTVNGQGLTPGVFLTYVITPTTVTVTDDLDCIEVAEYTVAGDRISGPTVSLTGSECGGQVGDVFEARFTVTSDTLTLFVTDDQLGAATFVFRRG